MPMLRFGAQTVDTTLPTSPNILGIANDIDVASTSSGATIVGIAQTDAGFSAYNLFEVNGITQTSGQPVGTYKPTYKPLNQPEVPDLAIATCVIPRTVAYPYPIGLIAFSSSKALHAVDLYNIPANGALNLLGSIFSLTSYPSTISCDKTNSIAYVTTIAGTEGINFTLPLNLTQTGTFVPSVLLGGPITSTALTVSNPDYVITTSYGPSNPTVFIFNRAQFPGTVLSTFTLPANGIANAMVARSNVLWLACGSYDVISLNITMAGNPVFLTTPVNTAGKNTVSVAVRGAFLLTADGSQSTARAAYLETDASSPTYSGKANLRGTPLKIIPVGKNTISLNSAGSFGITPTDTVLPSSTAITNFGDSAVSIAVSGGSGFVRGTNAIKMFATADQKLQGSWDTRSISSSASTTFNGMAIDPVTGKVYVVDLEGLTSIIPTQADLSANTTAITGSGIAAANGTVFITSIGGGLKAYPDAQLSASNPQAIFQSPVYSAYDVKFPTPYNKVYVCGSTYVLCYDVSQLPTVNLLWQCLLPSPAAPFALDVSVDGSNTFVVSNTKTLFIIDNNTHQIIGSIGTDTLPGFNPSDVKVVSRQYLAVTDQGNNCVQIIDWTDPTKPIPAGRAQTKGNPGKIAIDIANKNALVAEQVVGFETIANISPGADPQFTGTAAFTIAPGETRNFPRPPVNSAVTTVIPAAVSGLTITSPGTSNNSPVSTTNFAANQVQVTATSSTSITPSLGLQVASSAAVAFPEIPVGVDITFATSNPTAVLSPLDVAEGQAVLAYIRLFYSNGQQSASPSTTNWVDVTTNLNECFFSLTTAPNVPVNRIYPQNCDGTSGVPQLLFTLVKGNKSFSSISLTPTIGSLTGQKITITGSTLATNNQPIIKCNFNIDPAVITTVPASSALQLIQAGSPINVTIGAKNPNIPADNSAVACTVALDDSGAATIQVASDCKTATFTPSKLFQSNEQVTGTVCATIGSNAVQVCQAFTGTFTDVPQPPELKFNGQFASKDGVASPLTADLITMTNDGTPALQPMYVELVGNGCSLGAPGTEYKSSVNVTQPMLDAGSVNWVCSEGGTITGTAYYNGFASSQQFAKMNVAGTPPTSIDWTQWGILAGAGVGVTGSFYLMRRYHTYRQEKSIPAFFRKYDYSPLVKDVTIAFFDTFNTKAKKYGIIGFYVTGTTKKFVTAFKDTLEKLEDFFAKSRVQITASEDSKREATSPTHSGPTHSDSTPSDTPTGKLAVQIGQFSFMKQRASKVLSPVDKKEGRPDEKGAAEIANSADVAKVNRSKDHEEPAEAKVGDHGPEETKGLLSGKAKSSVTERISDVEQVLAVVADKVMARDGWITAQIMNAIPNKEYFPKLFVDVIERLVATKTKQPCCRALPVTLGQLTKEKYTHYMARKSGTHRTLIELPHEMSAQDAIVHLLVEALVEDKKITLGHAIGHTPSRRDTPPVPASGLAAVGGAVELIEIAVAVPSAGSVPETAAATAATPSTPMAAVPMPTPVVAVEASGRTPPISMVIPVAGVVATARSPSPTIPILGDSSSAGASDVEAVPPPPAAAPLCIM